MSIQEWRETHRGSAYPLVSKTNPAAIFVDASFVQFDSFTPVLQQVRPVADRVYIDILLDDGLYTHEQLGDECVEGAVIQLRNTDKKRYYGQLVTGSGLLFALNNFKGEVLKPAIAFSPLTVTSVQSKSGVFGISGLFGDITIKTDNSQFFTSLGANEVSWNAVSMPSNVPEVVLKDTCIYAVTDQKCFIELDPVTKAVSLICKLPWVPRAISTVACSISIGNTDPVKLIALRGKHFYDLTSLPPEELGELDDSVTASSCQCIFSGVDDDSRLFGLFDEAIYELYQDDGIATHLLDLEVSTATCCNDGNTWISFATVGGGNIVRTTLYGTGPDPEPGGVITVNQALQPDCKTLVKLPDDDNSVHGILYDADQHYLVKTSLHDGVSTVLLSFPVDSKYGRVVAATGGKNTVMRLGQVVPLKKINGIEPLDNFLPLRADEFGIFTVEQTAGDTFTISLAADTSNMNIRPSKAYKPASP